jgi:hypothetical protein
MNDLSLTHQNTPSCLASTGPQSCSVQASQNRQAETRLPLQQEPLRPPDTSAPAAQPEPVATTPASRSRSRASNCKPASELHAELLSLVAAECDKHTIGSRLTSQSHHNIKVGIERILSRYEVLRTTGPGGLG